MYGIHIDDGCNHCTWPYTTLQWYHPNRREGPPYFPMARAIVGGLTFSTIITLIVLPSIYLILDDISIWSKRVIRAA